MNLKFTEKCLNWAYSWNCLKSHNICHKNSKNIKYLYLDIYRIDASPSSLLLTEQALSLGESSATSSLNMCVTLTSFQSLLLLQDMWSMIPDAMPSDKFSDMDSHLQNSVRELKDLNQETKISTFFMYSRKNVPDSSTADKLVHPQTIYDDLQKQDFLNVYVELSNYQ